MRISHVVKTSTQLNAIKSTVRLGFKEFPKVFTSFIYDKFSILNNWYTRIIGLDEVKVYQDRVVTLQEKLLSAQDKRRQIGYELSEIRKKSNELQDQLHKIKRQDDLERFLNLMKDETTLMRQENEVTKAFTECDREERDVFTAFTNAIRDSHEKQRAQLEYTKYLGLILSITGSFLVFVYSTIWKENLKRFIETTVTKSSVASEDLLKLLQQQEREPASIEHKVDKDLRNIVKLNLTNMTVASESIIKLLKEQEKHSTSIREKDLKHLIKNLKENNDKLLKHIDSNFREILFILQSNSNNIEVERKKKLEIYQTSQSYWSNKYIWPSILLGTILVCFYRT